MRLSQIGHIYGSKAAVVYDYTPPQAGRSHSLPMMVQAVMGEKRLRHCTLAEGQRLNPSSLAVQVASLLGWFQIPVIGSIEWRDKFAFLPECFPYPEQEAQLALPPTLYSLQLI